MTEDAQELGQSDEEAAFLLDRAEAEEEMARLTQEFHERMQVLMDKAYPPDTEGDELPIPVPKQQVKNRERLETLINVELQKLTRLTGGAGTRAIDVDGFVIETQFKALIGYLHEIGVLKEEDKVGLHMYYGNLLLDKLRRVIEQGETEMARAKIMQGMENGPGILGPNGERLG